jgi:hypothetical protein
MVRQPLGKSHRIKVASRAKLGDDKPAHARRTHRLRWPWRIIEADHVGTDDGVDAGRGVPELFTHRIANCGFCTHLARDRYPQTID